MEWIAKKKPRKYEKCQTQKHWLKIGNTYNTGARDIYAKQKQASSYFTCLHYNTMATLILLNAAASSARADEHEKALKKVKKLETYIADWNTKIPKYLLSYEWELTPELQRLLETAEKLPESERSLIVTERIQTLDAAYLAAEKKKNEWEWGRDHHEAKVDREIYSNWIKLKLLSQNDANSLFHLLQNNHWILQHEVNGSSLPATLEETNAYISFVNNLFKNNKGYGYGVYINWDKLIWEVSLLALDKKIYEIWFRIGKEHANNGYITKAVEELKKLAFHELSARFVIINARKENHAANAVAKKTWFIKEEQNINNEPDKYTRSKSNRSLLGNLLAGPKRISDARNKEYENL